MVCDRGELSNYLSNFTGTDPIEAIACAYSSDAGAGMGLEVFGLFFIGMIGLGMTIRTQHPGPVVIAGILTIGALAARLPGPGLQIFAIVMFFAIAFFGIYIYQRAQSSL